MNFGTIDVLVSNHTGDIGRQLASRRAVARVRASRPALGAASRPGLRSQIGLALVEAGLRLQVAARPINGSGLMRLNERSYW
jgi:hypothetical protein